MDEGQNIARNKAVFGEEKSEGGGGEINKKAAHTFEAWAA